ncbi:hypothetical protein SAMN04487865_101912 [Succinivibrio dextrinosolvens]|uniref:Uncharacterized protein n=1 Tax=Succinivibrio dextrinosolvens TaxID=83771 RepID=A0A662ZAP5_9GAMM|nr:hypothetical protein SAMN04487865_101912 [Succinivibrio dextrinosolvens]
MFCYVFIFIIFLIHHKQIRLYNYGEKVKKMDKAKRMKALEGYRDFF